MVAGSADDELQMDEEVWNSHVGAAFRKNCDRYETLRQAIATGCKDDEVKRAFDAVCEELRKLRLSIVFACRQDQKLPRMLPDIGTVVSVGQKWEGVYFPGDHVAIRPGDVYYEEGGVHYRILRDRYDKHTKKFLYDVTDSVPMRLTDNLLHAMGTWTLAERVRKSRTLLSVKPEYTSEVDVQGVRMLFRAKEGGDGMLTFKNPQDWGLDDSHCLVQTSCLMAGVS